VPGLPLRCILVIAPEPEIHIKNFQIIPSGTYVRILIADIQIPFMNHPLFIDSPFPFNVEATTYTIQYRNMMYLNSVSKNLTTITGNGRKREQLINTLTYTHFTFSWNHVSSAVDFYSLLKTDQHFLQLDFHNRSNRRY
jgi:hypothetical protein